MTSSTAQERMAITVKTCTTVQLAEMAALLAGQIKAAAKAEKLPLRLVDNVIAAELIRRGYGHCWTCDTWSSRPAGQCCASA